MSVLLLVGLGWLVVALVAGLLIGGSIRTAEARRTRRAVPPVPGAPAAPRVRWAPRVLVGAAPSPRHPLETRGQQ